MRRYDKKAVLLATFLAYPLIISNATAQENDSLIVADVEAFAGDTAQASIYLRNSEFFVGGFTVRLELENAAFVSIVAVDRGGDIGDFEYFYASFDSGSCRSTAVVNVPEGGDPPPLPIGYHEIVRVMLAVSPEAPAGFSDSLYFREDTLPPPRDNSISDNTGYINLIPVLSGGRLEVISATGARGDQGNIPGRPFLSQNYPNPFNAETRISFELPSESEGLALVIFDMLGREVERHEWGRLPAGRHEVTWHGVDSGGRAIASGVYFYRLSGTDFKTALRKMIFLK